jgi:hypothetical protein
MDHMVNFMGKMTVLDKTGVTEAWMHVSYETTDAWKVTNYKSV